jgi:hypothetical protein
MSFSQSTKDKINGWGSVLRFVLPVMITIMLWILGDMRNQIRDVRDVTTLLAKETVTYNTNHLAHHAAFEVGICERLATIESVLRTK